MAKVSRVKLKSFAGPSDVPRRRPVQIGKDTLMPLGMVAGLLIAVVGCYGWLDSRFDGLNQNNNRRFGEIATALRGVEDRLRDLEIAQRHHWDSLDMKDWVLELKRLNPDLCIPPLASADSVARQPKETARGND